MYICLCNAVTERQIVQAAEDGARTSQDLAKELGVGLCCGRCADCANAVLCETVARLVDSKTLLAGHAQLAILHNKTIYFLRETRFGKLILTK